MKATALNLIKTSVRSDSVIKLMICTGLGAILACAKSPSAKITSVENGVSSGVRTSDDTENHHADSRSHTHQQESQSSPDTGSKTFENGSVSDQTAEAKDCFETPVSSDRNALASLAHQKVFSMNSEQSSLCDLIPSESPGSVSVLYILPDNCDERCLDDGLSLGLAVSRSPYQNHIHVRFLFNNQNLKVYGDFQKITKMFNLKATLVTQGSDDEPVLSELRLLAEENNSLIGISPGLELISGNTEQPEWLDIIKNAEDLISLLEPDAGLIAQEPGTGMKGTDFIETGLIDFISVTPEPTNVDLEANL